MTYVATPSKTATPTLLAFGVALKRARRAAHLTQAELAERAGFSVVYISMLECGARQPQPSTVALLVEALAFPSAERVALESAAQSPATIAARQRRGDDAATLPLPVGGFLGALPASMLVGRESELAVIQGTLTAVASGQGRLLILVGEPGVGKTRLAQEITLTARAQGFRVVTGRCYEPQQTVAYAPFLEALTQAVALTTDAVEGWPEVARLLPSANHDAHAPAQLDDGAAQQRLFYQVRNFLGALVDRQPLAVLLDDLHWADGASVDLLQHLARHTRDQPILLVGTARGGSALTDVVGAPREENRPGLMTRTPTSETMPMIAVAAMRNGTRLFRCTELRRGCAARASGAPGAIGGCGGRASSFTSHPSSTRCLSPQLMAEHQWQACGKEAPRHPAREEAPSMRIDYGSFLCHRRIVFHRELLRQHSNSAQLSADPRRGDRTPSALGCAIL